MSEQLQAGADWWQDDHKNEKLTPFDDAPPTFDKDPDAAQGDKDQKKSEHENATAEKADAKGDKFDLAVVLFALTLFFGGVATLLDRKQVTYALLGISVLTMAAGTVIVSQGWSLPQ